MTLKARVGVSATVVALIAVYAIAQGTKDELDKGKVTVTGMWLESPRSEGVEVIVSVGTDTKATRHLNAPFGPRVYKVPRGTRVMIRLRLLGASGAKFLGCTVAVDGVTQMETPAHGGVGPGTEAMCWAVA
jgi:hypothetical protein